MCFALTAHYDKQGFKHPHNQFHIVHDSVALAAKFGGVAAFGFEASEHEGHPDHPPGLTTQRKSYQAVPPTGSISSDRHTYL